MKKLMLAIAGALAIGFSARAEGDDPWFDGGITDGWPNAASMSGGSWSNLTCEGESVAWLVTNVEESVTNHYVQIDTDGVESNAVSFVLDPDNTKTLGVDVKRVSCDLSIEFEPFRSVSSIPLDQDAKAGVAVVTNGESQLFYVLARDPEAATNVWTATDVPAPADEASVKITVTNSMTAGCGAVVYRLLDTNVVVKDVVMDARTFSRMVFSGYGQISTMSGLSATNTALLKLPNFDDWSSSISNVVVSYTNNSTKGQWVVAQQVPGTAYQYLLTPGDYVVVRLYAQDGYLFPGSGKTERTYEGTIYDDSDMSDQEPEIPLQGEAKIARTSTLYLTLGEAIEAADPDDIVSLIKNVTTNLVIDSEKEFTLDLNGMTLEGADDGFVIENHGSLTLQDSVGGDNPGSVTGSGDILIFNDYGLSVLSGAYESNGGDGCVISNAYEISIEGGIFDGEISAGDSTGFIYGGKFVAEPEDAWIAEGYTKWEESGTGYWVVGQPANEAKIVETEEEYMTLQDALDAAEGNGYTVQLMTNVTADTVSVAAGVILDLTESYTLSVADVEGSVNQGRIVVYDATMLSQFADLAGTIEAGTAIGEEETTFYPSGTTITLTKEDVEDEVVYQRAIAVGSGTLSWNQGVSSHQQLTVTGNVRFSGDLASDDNEPFAAVLTIDGDVTLAADVAVGTNATMTVDGTIAVGDPAKKITLKSTSSTLENDGALVANEDVVTDVPASYVALSEGVYTVAAAGARIGDKYYSTLADALADDEEGTVVLLADADLDDLARSVTIDLNGFDLEYAGDALTNGLTVTGSVGMCMFTAGTVAVNADLNLAAIDNETQLQFGGFAIASGKTLTLNSAKTGWELASVLEGSADGAKLVTDQTYTYGNGVWTAGTEIGVAKIGDIGYATIKAALLAAQEDDTVTILANGTLTDAITANVTTKATTIDYNGKTNAIMKGSQTLTFNVSAGKTVTIRGGEDLNSNSSRKISIPANVNFTLEDMTSYGTLIPTGGSNAVFTCRNCLFSNKYDGNGSTNWNSGAYASYCISLNEVMFKTIIVRNNEFHPMVRPSLAMTGANNKFVEAVYVCDNAFIGDKSCQKVADAAKRYPAVFQLYSYPKAVYIENNSISGEYAQGIFSYSVKAGGDCDVICRGNTLDENQRYLWVLHDGGTITGSIRFGLNTFEGTVDTTQGVYGFETALESNGSYAYTETVASPVGYSSFCAWATGDDAANVYHVTKAGTAVGSYVDSIADIEAGDTLLVDPETEVVGLPATLALANVASSDAEYANKWTVIEKPTSITVAVTVGEDVASVTYGGTSYATNFTIEAVAPSTEMKFTVAFSGDQFVGNVSASGNVTGGATAEGYTYTVDADLTNPNATIAFNATVVEAVVYSTADDSFIARCTTFADAYAAMKTANQYVRFFKSYIGSDVTEQISFSAGDVARFDLNGCTVIAYGQAFYVAVEPGEKYTTYTAYPSVAAAFEAKGSAATYAIGGNVSADLSAVTNTPDRLSFKGVLWQGYNYWTTVKDATEPVCDDCEKTAAWGWDATAHTFDYTAVAYTTVTVTEAAHAESVVVSTNGASVAGAPYTVLRKAEVTVVWTADEGYAFEKGVTAYTNTFVATQAEMTASVPAEKAPVKVLTGITLSESAVSLDIGGTTNLTFAVEPADAATNSVVWTSSNESVATVEDGLVTALAKGAATITVKVTDRLGNEASAACSVSIAIPVSKITVAEVTGATAAAYTNTVGEATRLPGESPYTIAQGEFVHIVYTAKAGYEFAGGATTWSTNFTADAAAIAVTVPEDKKPTLKIATITLKPLANADTVNVYTNDGVEVTVAPYVVLRDAAVKVVWTANEGYAFAKDVTTYETNFTANAAEMEVEAEKAPVKVLTGVALSATAVDLDIGGTTNLTFAVEPVDAATNSVVWTSSDESVATVADGLVTAVSAGAATVTVTVTDKLGNEKSATCAVAVAMPLSTVTVAEVTGATAAAYTNEVGEATRLPEPQPYTVFRDASVIVVYTAKVGYEFAGGAETFETNFTASAAAVSVTVPEDKKPALKKIALTITQEDDATNTAVTVNGAAPAATYDYGTALEIVVTPSNGWEYAAESYEGWTLAEGNLTTNIAAFTEATEIKVPAPTIKMIALTIDGDTTNATVTVNGEAPEATYAYGTELTVVATPKVGFEYAAESYEGWTKVEGALTKTIASLTEATTVTVPAPTAKMLALTIVQDGDATNAIVTVNGEAPVAEYAYGTKLEIVSTPSNGWEYAAESYEGWTTNESGALVKTIEEFVEPATVTVPVPTAKQTGPVTPPAGGGSIDPVPGEPGVYVVDADPSSGEVTVIGVTETDTIRVTTTNDIVIIGVPADQIQVKIDGTVIPNGALKGGDETRFDTALTDAAGATVEIEGETIKVTPEIGETEKVLVDGKEEPAFTPSGDDTAVAVKAIPGLTYELVGGDDVGNLSTSCDRKKAEGTKAKGYGIKLENNGKVSGDKAFFRVKVSK